MTDPRILECLEMLQEYGQCDGGHHKAWVIDQAARILTGPDYQGWVDEYRAGEYGPDTYEWDEGIAP